MADKAEKMDSAQQKAEQPKESKEEKKHAKPEKQAAPKPAGRAMPVGAKRIVRLMQTDVNGDLSVERAMREIKGVSFMLSHAVCIATGIDGSRKIADLGEHELKSIEAFIKSPQLPAWMLNRRKDIDTGRDRHIVMSELDLQRREDINLMKRIRSYKGVRHELGQPVRGQRTRSSFRTQKTVGVARKKVVAAAKAAAAPKKEEKK